MTVHDPILAAAREVLELAFTEMRGCIEGGSPDALNWRPGGDDTNSLAVLAVHSLGSTRSWLSVALGAPRPDRDRDAEFATNARDAASLLAHFDQVAGDCTALVAGAANIDWSALVTTHARPGGDAKTEVLASWALIHALEHLREHEGQMFLTRQLWDQRAAG